MLPVPPAVHPQKPMFFMYYLNPHSFNWNCIGHPKHLTILNAWSWILGKTFAKFDTSFQTIFFRSRGQFQYLNFVQQLILGFFFFFPQQLHTTMFLKLHKYLPFMDTGYLYSNKSVAFIQVYRTLVQSNRVLFLLYKLSIDWCMLGGLCDTGVGIRTTLTIWTEDRENLLLMLDKIYRKKDV